VPTFVITVVDRPDGHVDVTFGSDAVVVNDPTTVLTGAQAVAVAMLTVGVQQAHTVVQDRGLLDLLPKAH